MTSQRFGWKNASMKLQTPDSPNCGAVSLCNALRCFGVFLTEDSAVRLCGTSSDGTDERDLMRAIQALGMRKLVISQWSRGSAQVALRSALQSGNPCIIAIDDYGHWVTVIGKLGHDHVVVVDSTNEGDNPSELGTWVVSLEELCDRWECSPAVAGGEAPFYGLCLVNPGASL